MNIDKKFSILIPTYNQREDYLFSAIQSCIGQIYTPHEIIICNDGGSNDLIKDIYYYVKESEIYNCFYENIEGGELYSTEIQVNNGKNISLKIINMHQNKGGGAALNTARKFATGDYYAWISSDDFFYPHFLLVNSKLLDYGPLVYSGFSEAIFDYNTDELMGVIDYPPPFNIEKKSPILKLSSANFQNSLRICLQRRSCFYNGCGFVYKKDVIDDIGYFNEDFLFMPDFELWLRMSQKYDLIVNLQILLCRREHNRRFGFDWGQEKYDAKRNEEFSKLEERYPVDEKEKQS